MSVLVWWVGATLVAVLCLTRCQIPHSNDINPPTSSHSISYQSVVCSVYWCLLHGYMLRVAVVLFLPFSPFFTCFGYTHPQRLIANDTMTNGNAHALNQTGFAANEVDMANGNDLVTICLQHRRPTTQLQRPSSDLAFRSVVSLALSPLQESSLPTFEKT